MKKILLDEVNSTLRNYTQGTPKSRQEKRNALRHIIKDLLDLNIAPDSFKLLTKENICSLVSFWQDRGNSHSTIINKLGILRFFNQKGGFGISIPDNLTFKLNKNYQRKAPFLPDNIVSLVSNPITEIILQLQIEFGLTKIEALRLRPASDINKSDLIVSKVISYNRKERFIAIYRPSQKEVIKKLNALLQERNCISDFATERHILNLYNAELAIQGVDYNANFRIVYANTRLAELQRKKVDRNDAYRILMDEMGYHSKHTLLEAVI